MSGDEAQYTLQAIFDAAKAEMAAEAEVAEARARLREATESLREAKAEKERVIRDASTPRPLFDQVDRDLGQAAEDHAASQVEETAPDGGREAVRSLPWREVPIASLPKMPASATAALASIMLKVSTVGDLHRMLLSEGMQREGADPSLQWALTTRGVEGADALQAACVLDWFLGSAHLDDDVPEIDRIIGALYGLNPKAVAPWMTTQLDAPRMLAGLPLEQCKKRDWHSVGDVLNALGNPQLGEIDELIGWKNADSVLAAVLYRRDEHRTDTKTPPAASAGGKAPRRKAGRKTTTDEPQPAGN